MTTDVNDTKRLNYFKGEFLQDRDFIDEQTYHLSSRRRHNQQLHGFGIAGGLAVTKSDDHHVQVTPGTAIDNQGREIVITFPVIHEVKGTTPNVYLTIAYTELKIDEDIVHEGGASDARRWTERPDIAESANPPPTDGSVIILARIVLKADAAHTIDTVDVSVAQKAAVSVVAPGVIGEAQLGASSVTFDKLAKDAVQGDRIKDGTVTTGKLAPGSVGGPEASAGLAVLADRGITAAKLAVGSIGGADGSPGLSVLADAGITHEKLAIDAVQTDKIKDHAITPGKLADGAVGFLQLAITKTRDTPFNGLNPGQTVTATLTLNTTVPQFLFYGVSISSSQGASLSFIPWSSAPSAPLSTTILMDASGNGDVTYTVFLKNITGGAVSGFVRMQTIAMVAP